MFTLTGTQVPVTVVLKGRRYYEENEVRIENCYYIRKAPTGSIVDLTDAKVTLKGTTKAIPSQMYTAKSIKPEIDLLFRAKKSSVSGAKLGLKEGRDYKVYYFDNVKLGTALVFVKALSNNGKAIGCTTTSFKIVRRES